MYEKKTALSRSIRLSDNDERLVKMACLHNGAFLSQFIREAAVARARKELRATKFDNNAS